MYLTTIITMQAKSIENFEIATVIDTHADNDVFKLIHWFTLDTFCP